MGEAFQSFDGTNMQRNNWSWRDAAFLGSAIGAGILSTNEDIPPWISNLLDIYANSPIPYYLLRLWFQGESAREERNQRILSGIEPINRVGEQLLLLMGNGSYLGDEFFSSDPVGAIPIVHTATASNRMRERVVAGDFGIPFPYHINLNIELGRGSTVVDTSALNNIQLSKDNLFITPEKEFLIAISLGDSFLPKIFSQRTMGIGHADSHVLYSRLVNNALRDSIIESSDQAIMIRIASMFDRIENSQYIRDKGNTINALLENQGRIDPLYAGGLLRVDTWLPVLLKLRNIVDTLGGTYENVPVGVMIDSDTTSLQSLPFLSSFGLEDLGMFYSPDGVKNTREFIRRTQGDIIVVHIENSDVATLTKVNTASEDSPKSQGMQEVFIFETLQAAQMARDAGAQNVICSSQVQAQYIERILQKLRDGFSVGEIQNEMLNVELHMKEAELHAEQKIKYIL